VTGFPSWFRSLNGPPMAGVPTDCPGFTALVLFFNSGEDGREYHEKIKQDSRS